MFYILYFSLFFQFYKIPSTWKTRAIISQGLVIQFWNLKQGVPAYSLKQQQHRCTMCARTLFRTVIYWWALGIKHSQHQLPTSSGRWWNFPRLHRMAWGEWSNFSSHTVSCGSEHILSSDFITPFKSYLTLSLWGLHLLRSVKKDHNRTNQSKGRKEKSNFLSKSQWNPGFLCGSVCGLAPTHKVISYIPQRVCLNYAGSSTKKILKDHILLWKTSNTTNTGDNQTFGQTHRVLQLMIVGLSIHVGILLKFL